MAAMKIEQKDIAGPMRKEQKDIAGLNPIGILREGLKVYRANVRVVFLIQLTLMLPLAILVLGLNYLVVSKLNVPANLSAAPPGFSFIPRWPQLDPFLMLFEPAVLQLDPILVVCAASAFTFVIVMLLSLAQSVSLYAVGLHYYTGQPVAFLDVLRVAMPRLWKRMAVTNAWSSFMALGLDVTGTACVLAFTPGFGYPLGQIVAFAAMILGVYRTAVFTIAPAVSVLEGDYGLPAARKSVKLLNGPLNVAVWFHVLLLVPKFLGVAIGWYVVDQVNKGDFSGWNGAQLVLLTVVFLVWTIIGWQLEYLCSGVQYVSFKAYHDESLADPFLQSMNGVFISVGDGSNMAMLREKEAGIMV